MMTFNFRNNFNGKLFNDVFGELMIDDIRIGDEVSITYQNQELGIAEIVEIKTFPFSGLKNRVSFLNCGEYMPTQAAILNRYYNQGKTLPQNQEIKHVIFKYTKRNLPNLETKISEWLAKQKEKYETN